MTEVAAAILVAASLAMVARSAPAAKGPFDGEMEMFDREDARHVPGPGAVVFAGSSSLRLWTNMAEAFPGVPLLNRGFGGSTMPDLLNRMDRLVLSYRPSVVLVYEGDNDLAGGRSPREVLADFETFLRRMAEEAPGAVTVLLAVKPCPSRLALIKQQREVNAGLKALAAARPKMLFADTFSPLLNAAGEPEPSLYKPDRLHLNQLGYERWAALLRPILATARAGVSRP